MIPSSGGGRFHIRVQREGEAPAEPLDASIPNGSAGASPSRAVLMRNFLRFAVLPEKPFVASVIARPVEQCAEEIAMQLLKQLAKFALRLARFRITARMVACVVVPALILAGCYYYWTRSQSRLIEQIEQMGGSVGKKGKYTWSATMVSFVGSSVTDEQLGYLNGLSNVTGLHLGSPHITDAGLVRLGSLTSLTSLNLVGTPVTDEGLQHLTRLSRLEMLSLSGMMITDDGMRHVQKLTGLKRLRLERTRVTDAGLAHLGALSSLTSLTIIAPNVADEGAVEWMLLNESRITDRGLRHLERLTKLRHLQLGRTDVTDRGIQKLEQVLPQLQFAHSRDGVLWY